MIGGVAAGAAVRSFPFRIYSFPKKATIQCNTHWTARSTEDFVYRISSDFALQIEDKMDRDGISQSHLARSLGVTDGRVSQVLNNPGNLTLKKMVEYATSLGMKVSIVAYEDGDPENHRGPIHAQIFNACWMRAGRPNNFSQPFVKRFNIQLTREHGRSIPSPCFHGEDSWA